jgi:hypothetical protein
MPGRTELPFWSPKRLPICAPRDLAQPRRNGHYSCVAGEDDDDLEVIELESVEILEPGRLIRTARHRSRVAAAVVVAAALLVSGGFALSSARPDTPEGPGTARPSSLDIVPNNTAPPLWPFRGPLLLGSDTASTLLASWGDMHFGFVFVYADGRVISYPEAGVVVDAGGRVRGVPIEPFMVSDEHATAARAWMNGGGLTRNVPAGEFVFAVIERRLSSRGLKLVRAGQLAAKDIVVPDLGRVTPEMRRTVDPSRWPLPISPYQRFELWAEPTARTYEPSKYAICNLAPDAWAGFPPTVQALLAGKERNYDPILGTRHWSAPGERSAEPMKCFELTSADASTLHRIADSDHRLLYESWPVYPHGHPVAFGAPSYGRAARA